MTFKELRKRKNVSQQEIGKELNLGNTTISMWETGKSTPKLKQLRRLASLLSSSFDEIISCFESERVEKITYKNENTTDLIAVADGLSNEDLILLIGYANFLRGLKNGN